jgi:hypothetical protein
MNMHWSGVAGGFRFTRNKKKISACQVNIAWGTDWVKKTIAIHNLSLKVAPNKTCPTVTERSALQRDFGLLIGVHGRSDSP